jgi:hypothetical protein
LCARGGPPSRHPGKNSSGHPCPSNLPGFAAPGSLARLRPWRVSPPTIGGPCSLPRVSGAARAYRPVWRLSPQVFTLESRPAFADLRSSCLYALRFINRNPHRPNAVPENLTLSRRLKHCLRGSLLLRRRQTLDARFATLCFFCTFILSLTHSASNTTGKNFRSAPYAHWRRLETAGRLIVKTIHFVLCGPLEWGKSSFPVKPKFRNDSRLFLTARLRYRLPPLTLAVGTPPPLDYRPICAQFEIRLMSLRRLVSSLRPPLPAGSTASFVRSAFRCKSCCVGQMRASRTLMSLCI